MRRSLRSLFPLCALAVLMSCPPAAALSPLPQPAQSPPANAVAQHDLLGTYSSRGVREVAAQIRLSPDGRFSFSMAYGGVDMAAEGKWATAGGELTLTTDPAPAPSFTLGERSGTQPDDYDQHAEKPTLLAVRVTTPRLGLFWSDIDVTAQFSNGKSRSGKTGTRGYLGFIDRHDEAEWRGAVVRRVSVADPGRMEPVWFEIDPQTTRSIVVHYEPGSLAARPFDTLVLKVNKDKGGEISLKQAPGKGPGQRGWTFVK